jgi:hypothetical protein
MSDIFGDKDWFVVDDILTEEEQNQLGLYLTSTHFPYYLSNFLTVTKEVHDKFKHLPNIKDHIQMVHQFYKKDEVTNDTIPCTDDEHLEWINLLLRKMATYLKQDRLNIIRVKANLQKQVTDNKKEYHNTPHIDEPSVKHWVCIYYVNDSDGDTLFFDNEKDCNITDIISPKKGRFLFFKGNKLHTGKHPMNTYIRLVLNMDFYYD